MPREPQITVQLIHIEGPLKGEIQEFTDSEITIGRHPSCHVLFPKDYATISRFHAKIVREGNRFKLINQSANGTFIKGKAVDETYLSSGDVLIFAEQSGPKVSFIMEMGKPVENDPGPASREQTTQHSENEFLREQPKSPPAPPLRNQEPPAREPAGQSIEPPEVHSSKSAAGIEIVPTQAPLAIQFGPMLKAYKKLPITIGRHPSCEFPMDLPMIADRHAQIFFALDQYGVKDLTGRNMVLINQKPIGNQALLSPGDAMALSPEGPYLQFFAGGRLAETNRPTSGSDSETPASAETDTSSKSADDKKGKSMFGKLFNR